MKKQARGRCILVLTVVPDYRRTAIEELSRALGSRFELLVGSSFFSETIATDPELVQRFGTIENTYFSKRRFVFQRLPLASLLRASVVITELNPRVLSNWLILIPRAILRRPTVLWGHAWSKDGPDAPMEPVRNLQRKLASTIVVYTESQRDSLARKMPRKRIIAAPNALYRRSDMRPAECAVPATDILYVGRLVREKKPHLLLEGYLQALVELPGHIRLVFVGDGPELARLRHAARPFGTRIVFHGHISDREKLREIYSGTIASASPGYVGLSITQSLGFGVPMLIADHEPHSPEIEAADEHNSRFFRANDPRSAAEAIIDMVEERELWAARRSEIAEQTADRYSLEVMISRLLDSLTA